MEPMAKLSSVSSLTIVSNSTSPLSPLKSVANVYSDWEGLSYAEEARMADSRESSWMPISLAASLTTQVLLSDSISSEVMTPWRSLSFWAWLRMFEWFWYLSLILSAFYFKPNLAASSLCFCKTLTLSSSSTSALDLFNLKMFSILLLLTVLVEALSYSHNSISESISLSIFSAL